MEVMGPLDADAPRERLATMKEDRLIMEMREMRRQIQMSAAEEIKSQSRQMLQELKREVRSAVKTSVQQVQPTLWPPNSTIDCSTVEGLTEKAHFKAIPSRSLQRSPTYPLNKQTSRLPQTPEKARGVEAPPSKEAAEPQCPLTAHGDMPPMMPFQTEGPPPPPVVDGEDPPRIRSSAELPGCPDEDPPADLRAADAISMASDAKSVSYGYEECEWDKQDADGDNRKNPRTKGSRRLSLAVDVCRRTIVQRSAPPVWKMTAAQFLQSTKFDNLIGALILLNAIAIGVQTDYAAKNTTEVFPSEFQIIERIFLTCFFLELCLRVYVQRCRFFCGFKNIFWNYFDLAVVAAQIFEEALLLVAQNVNMNTGMFTVLRILRILRIIRILRVVRVLHLISELRTIVSSIIGSLKSLAWVVVLLLLVIYIVGVYFTQAITDHMVELNNRSIAPGQKDTDLQYFFGSLSRTILSLFQSMSGGADWDSMAGPLIEQVGTMTGLLFAAFIAFSLLALMNVVTGVFVQTALQSAKDEEDTFLVDQVLKLFNKAACSDTETITLSQIEDKFNDPEVAREWKAINVQPAEARYLFGLLDVEETGEISFQEFLSGCLRIHGPSKSMDMLTVMQEARTTARRMTLATQRSEEYHRHTQAALESIANAITTSSSLMAHLSLSIGQAVEVANLNQDKIGRLERRIRSFEGSLCSVRFAANHVNKVTDILDSVLAQGDNSREPPENGNPSGLGSSTMLGQLGTIDEV